VVGIRLQPVAWFLTPRNCFDGYREIALIVLLSVALFLVVAGLGKKTFASFLPVVHILTLYSEAAAVACLVFWQAIVSVIAMNFILITRSSCHFPRR